MLRRGDHRFAPRQFCYGGGLVPRTRSSHYVAASTVGNFGLKSGTRIIGLPVSLSIPKFAQGARQTLANFGIGTLALASWPDTCIPTEHAAAAGPAAGRRSCSLS